MSTIDFTDSIYDAQQGNQSAVKYIYDNTIQLFYKEATVIMRDKNEADRAIRDAYLFIFQHLNSLEDPSKFLLWANEICKNTCITRLKDAGVFHERIPAEAANLGEILPAEDYDPQINRSAHMPVSHIQVCLEAILDKPEYGKPACGQINRSAHMPVSHIQVCLEAILDSLPDNQRACVIFWAEGYPIRSIARKLGLNSVAVNYTLAYALGNITNAVTTLGDNGLPLFSMDPIPYFLWLLLSYYQLYQPEELVPGIEANFPNILRMLMPEEASVFVADYIHPDYSAPDSRVTHISNPVYPEPEADPFAGEIDLLSFIKKDDSAQDAEAIFDSIADSIISDNEFQGTQEPQLKVPPMDIYLAHEPSDAAEALKAGVNANLADDLIADAQVDSAGAADKTAADAEDRHTDAAASVGAAGIAAAASESEAASGSGSSDGSSAAEGTEETSSEAEGTNEAASAENPASAAADTAETAAAAETVSAAGAGAAEAGDKKEKKRYTGLIIFLIILLVILCLIAALIFFGGDSLKKKINGILGTNLFPVTETSQEIEPVPADDENLPAQDEENEPASVQEPVSGDDTANDNISDDAAQENDTTAADAEETASEDAVTDTAADPSEAENAAEEETIPEETTTQEEPTTEEPTTEALLTGPPYSARIYAEWDSLGMHVRPDVESEAITYVPYDTEVTVDDVDNGWGHITYDGMDGWIWLGYAKITSNLQAEQPETMLEETIRGTVVNTGETGLELRTGPADNLSTFGPVPEGTVLVIEAYNYNESWGYTSYDGHYGWVDMAYLQQE